MTTHIRKVVGCLFVALAVCFSVPACEENDIGPAAVDQACEVAGPVVEAVVSRLAAGKTITAAIIAAITGVIVEDACLEALEDRLR
ncbi:hypothetical protein [Nocardia caishijiensis]|uniref:Uncharacterized protein n=1 Tax=Nocardia caishijiensis TaxID=184756 RepID=A0ABQ6YQP9_9NOCA|nr:hypothetical protein [Nocardia caishijiensis]KAF0848080.1 hypothetical protein FNL39_102227 [Nocardia caishijiensis]